MVTLFATLGTRDVQFTPAVTTLLKDGKLEVGDHRISFIKQRNSENYELAQPRDAEFLLNLPEFHYVMVLPIVLPVLEYLDALHGQIDKLVLVCTNQTDAEDYFHIKDTLYYASLIEEMLPGLMGKKVLSVKKLEICERVSEIDYQYTRFRKIFIDDTPPDKNDALYLLPQGGIDQINTAIMLRLIEKNPNVKLLQVPELGEIRILDFPRQFVYNMTKHKALELLKDYHFAGVAALVEGPARFTALVANALINLSKPAFSALWMAPENKISIDFLRARYPALYKALQDQQEDHEGELWPLRIYESAKVRYRQGNMADMLWRLFALSELILKRPLKEALGIEFDDGPDYAKLNRVITQEHKLMQTLKTNLKMEPGKVMPTYAALVETAHYFLGKGHNELSGPLKVALAMKKLREIRNTLVHTGTGLDEKSLKRWMANHDGSLEGMLTTLDNHFEINKSNPCGLPDVSKNMIDKGV